MRTMMIGPVLMTVIVGCSSEPPGSTRSSCCYDEATTEVRGRCSSAVTAIDGDVVSLAISTCVVAENGQERTDRVDVCEAECEPLEDGGTDYAGCLAQCRHARLPGGQGGEPRIP